MKVISQNKLAKRFLLLVVLAGTLVYLRTPTKLSAETCDEECLAAYDGCTTECLKFRNPAPCLAACYVAFEECEADCN